MAHEFGYELSRQPALRNLQVLQFAADLIEDSAERETIARREIARLPLRNIIGRLFAVDASVAIMQERERRRSARVHDSGLMFLGRATNVDFYRNYEVPVESVVIDFSQPHVLVAEELVDDELAESIIEVDAPVADSVRVPILAIRACAVELPKAA